VTDGTPIADRLGDGQGLVSHVTNYERVTLRWEEGTN
jgi:hypothetical protein